MFEVHVAACFSSALFFRGALPLWVVADCAVRQADYVSYSPAQDDHTGRGGKAYSLPSWDEKCCRYRYPCVKKKEEEYVTLHDENYESSWFVCFPFH